MYFPGVKLFGRGQDQSREALADLEQRLATVERELAKCQSDMRTLSGEQDAMHQRVHGYMRRAIAAERASGRNQESLDLDTGTAPVEPVPATTPAPKRRTLWGARGRRAMRGVVSLAEQAESGG